MNAEIWLRLYSTAYVDGALNVQGNNGKIDYHLYQSTIKLQKIALLSYIRFINNNL